MLRGFVLISLLALAATALEVRVLLLFAVTREETRGDELIRVVEPGNTAAFVSSAALINQLNNNIDPVIEQNYACDNITFRYTLADTKADFSFTLEKLIAEGGDLESFDLILGPSRSTTCIPVSFASSPFGLPAISPTCTTSELNDVISHPRMLRTIPSDDFTAKTLVEVLEVLPTGDRSPDITNSIEELQKYTQVVVIYQEDSYGSKYKDSIFENKEDIEFIFFPFKPEDEVSIELAVKAAAATKLNVYVGIFNLESLRLVVEKAKEAGTIGPGRLWLFSDGVLGASEIEEDLVNGNEDLLPLIQNNYMVQATGGNSAPANDFKEEFMSSASGYDVPRLARELNVAVADDDFSVADFEQRLRSMAGKPTDFGLFAYDGVLAVRKFIDLVQQQEGNTCETPIDFNTLPDLMKRPSSKFDSVTGEVKFNEEGARDVETAKSKLVRLTFGPDAEEEVLAGEYATSWTLVANNIVFNGENGDKAPVLVDPPPEVTVLTMDEDIQTALNVTGAIILLIVASLYLFIYQSRDRNVIKAAQPFFLCVMLLGVTISTASVFFQRDESEEEREEEIIDSFRCNAPFFLISLGITVTFSALVFKLERVATVANTTPELRDNKVYSIWDSIRLMLVVIAVNLALIILAYNVNPLKRSQTVSEEDEFGQAIELYELCVPDENGNGSIYGLLITFHVLFYLYAFRLVFKTKDMSTDFQEGKWIAFSVMAQFQLFALGIPVVIAVGSETAGVRFLVISLIVLFSNIILLGLIFVPKIYRVISGDDDVVWSDRNDPNSGILHYSSHHKAADSRGLQDVRKSLYNTMATQEFGHEATL